MSTPSAGLHSLVRSSSFKSLNRVGDNSFPEPSTPLPGKSVRFSNGPSAPSQLLHALPLASTPLQDRMNVPQRAVSTPQSSSSFNNSLQRRPLGSQQHLAPIVRPTDGSANPQSTPQVTSSSAPRKATESSRNMVLPRCEQLARIKWNIGAALVLLVGPRIDMVRQVYWSFLRAVHTLSSADGAVDTLVSMSRAVLFLVFLYNIADAVYGLSQPVQENARKSSSSNTPQIARLAVSSPPGASPRNASGSLSYSSPKTRPSPMAANRSRSLAESSRNSPSPSPSPLKAHIAAARSFSGTQRSSFGPFADRSSSPSALQQFRQPSLGDRDGPRMPSTFRGAVRATSSPLAAYLARRSVSAGPTSGLQDEDDDSDNSPNASVDAIQVRRALRTLSASVEPSATAITAPAASNFAPSQTTFVPALGTSPAAVSPYTSAGVQANTPSAQHPYAQAYMQPLSIFNSTESRWR